MERARTGGCPSRARAFSDFGQTMESNPPSQLALKSAEEWLAIVYSASDTMQL